MEPILGMQKVEAVRAWQMADNLPPTLYCYELRYLISLTWIMLSTLTCPLPFLNSESPEIGAVGVEP